MMPSTLTPFEFLTAGHIRFGRGQAEHAVAAVRAFGRRVLLVRGGSVAWVDALHGELESGGAQVATIECRQEPDLPMLEQGRDIARSFGAEVVVAVGGGAVIDLAKALAALAPSGSPTLDHLESVGAGKPLTEDPLPFVAVPTTSGTGAEVTKNAVISVPDAGRKVSLRDARMIPDVAIVDPALTDNAPRGVTLASGLDAVVQVIEPYLSPRATPITDALTRQAIPMGLTALAVLSEKEDRKARDHMAFVSLCGGIALANAGLGAVHGLAGVIGGRLGAAHGLICGRLLGPVLAANTDMLRGQGADLSRFDEVAGWISTSLSLEKDTVFEALDTHLDSWGVARLNNWIGADADLEAIAAEAAASSSMKANPCVLPQSTLVEIIKSAV